MRQPTRPRLRGVLLAAIAPVALGVCAPARAAESATVVSSTPVTAQVAVPRQSCVESEQYVQPPPTGAGAVIGAIAGGFLGSAVGGGFGRAAATGAGVVAGSVIGNQVEANGNPVTAVPVRRCRTVNAYESRVVGYDVVYDYAGQRYSTRMASDPGRQFAVDVRPAASAPMPPAPIGAPAPVPYYDASAAPAPAAPVEYYDPLPQPAPAYSAPYGYYAPAPAVYAAPMVGVGIGLGYSRGWHGRRWH